jgi:two-component system CheB/CheR fusion protein
MEYNILKTVLCLFGEKLNLKKNHSRHPIVGVGASAGGLEAFKQFLSTLPIDTGMAFVLIQHLDPTHESLSSDILSHVTKMVVSEVKDGMITEPNHVYVLPSGFNMELIHGVLKLSPRPEIQSKPIVIDIFFRSLAQDQKDMAVGIVLSGAGDDGTEGILAIRAEGGITFSQDLETANFKDMPKNAIASGAVDLILSPELMGAELARIAHHQFIFPAKASEDKSEEFTSDTNPKNDLNQIFLLLRNQCHIDFTHYKSSTIQRRLARRMFFHKSETVEVYAKFLAENPEEVKALCADILIHVTQFFRDSESHKAMCNIVFPKLMKDRKAQNPIRVWIPGCSTGEEVYSIAISLLEYLGDQASNTPIQIFASDVSEQAILKARRGEYPESISRDISPKRLNRFFTKLDNGNYKVSKSIRDICLFSRHDITTDPPFARIDLISCRNLMIYLTVYLQKHLIPIFHYALKPNAFLWLGSSETIGDFTNLFSVSDKFHKVYQRKNATIAMNLNFPASTYVTGNHQSGVQSMTREIELKAANQVKPMNEFQKIADLALQEEYPGVLINEEMEILEFRGKCSRFIEPVAGVAILNITKMIRPEFLSEFKMLFLSSKKTNSPQKRLGLSFKSAIGLLTVDMKIIPFSALTSNERFYFVLFENAVDSELPKKTKLKKGETDSIIKDGKNLVFKKSANDQYLIDLQQELQTNHEYQQGLIEKYEHTQEDLSTANEELQSTNEEFQSTNEELETAKEELQSSNEELTTVNDELQSRSIEQVQLSNDLINLLGSVDIPILMIDKSFCIRRFTPRAGKSFNLIPSDVGRPISDLKLNLTSSEMDLDLNILVAEVLDTLVSKEIEVKDANGYWFRMQIKPYRTIDHRIDGGVIALVDIDVLKQSLKQVEEAKREAEKANRGKDLFLATLSHELRTPLTSILTWAQLLRMGGLSEEKSKKAIGIIEESGKTQAQLIDDLLDVSRIIAGKLILSLQEINPIDVILKTVDTLRLTAESKSIKIEENYDPEVGTVMADPLRLQQIFSNLLTNAVKFSAPHSTVFINLTNHHDTDGIKTRAMIQVIDSGKGVDPEYLPYIFDRFSQEDSSSVRLHGGLGLGLAIVRNLVELHGGTVRVEAQGSKPGATFTILLPIKTIQVFKAKTTNNTDEENAEINLKGIRVLIVDDEASPREGFTEILRSFGAEAKSIDTAQGALDMMGDFKPDILVSDIAMPNEDGYSLIQKIRQRSPELGGKIPVIAVTAYVGAVDVKHILAAGFQAHIAKPLDGFHLAQTVWKLVKSSTNK